MSNKIFVLDSNVILNDPHCIYGFQENDVYIPYIVLEEIDSFKKKNNSLGFSAREFARNIDDLRDKGSLQEGVELKTGGTFKVIPNKERDKYGIDDEVNDETILNTAKTLQEKSEKEVVLVTKDTVLRVKADSIGLISENYKNEEADDKTLFDDIPEYWVPEKAPSEAFSKLAEEGKITANAFFELDLHENEYFLLKQNQSPVLVRRSGRYLYKIDQNNIGAFGIGARNKEQACALNALLDESIKLVCLSGRSGTGKTICSLAAGLQKVTNEEVYDKVLVTKSVMSVGNEIGFLPGDMRDKMDPWMSPYYDNISQLFNDPHDGMKDGKDAFESMENQDWIDIQSIAHIRGRSIANSFVIVDEAQNLSTLEVKTIATRIAEGSKLVMIGDPEQIDNPYLDQYSNGLSHVIDKFRGEEIFAHVNLVKGERSQLSDRAAKLL